MKNKIIGLIIGGLAIVTIIATAGGWLDNDGGGSENPGGGSAPIVDKPIEVDVLREYNTDEPLSNLTVEIDRFLDRYIIFKVTNDSDVCYSGFGVNVYFTSDPIPNWGGVQDEYELYYNFSSIPAYSTTYHLKDAFGIEVSVDKGGGYDGRRFYPFDENKDTYRIEIVEYNDFYDEIDYTISDEPIQNAMEFVNVDLSTQDLTTNQIASITNNTNREIEFHAFVILDNNDVVDIESNKWHILYNNYETCIEPDPYGSSNELPAKGSVCRVEDEVIDCGPYFIYPGCFDATGYTNVELVIGNAYFVDEDE